MGLATAQRSVTASAAVALNAAGWTDNVPGGAMLARNTHATVSVFVGKQSVIAAAGYASNGFELVAGAALPADLQDNEIVYARAATGTVRVDVFETGV